MSSSSYNEGKSLSINKDLTQSVLEFIAHQPVNLGLGPQSSQVGSRGNSQGSGGQIGFEGARRIIETGGSERDAYLQQFQEANPRYKIESINTEQEKAGLSAKYETASNKVKAGSDVMQRHAQNTDNVLAQGNKVGLDPNQTPKSIKQEVTDFINKNDQNLLKGKGGVDAHAQDLKYRERASQEKTLGVQAIGNLVESGWDGAMSVYKDVKDAYNNSDPSDNQTPKQDSPPKKE